MRIPVVDHSNAHPHSRAFWEDNGQDADTLLYLIRTWAWSPWLGTAHQRLSHALHDRTPVPLRWKETAILRALTQPWAPYELTAHTALAQRVGLTPAEIDIICAPAPLPPNAVLDPETSICVRYVDDIIACRGVQDERFAALQQYLHPGQIVSLTLQACFWASHARFANALRLEPEPWIERSADKGKPWSGLSRLHDSVLVDAAPPALDIPPGGDAGRLGFPVPGERMARALASWPGGLEAAPAVLHTWSWVDTVASAMLRVWREFAGDHAELPRAVRECVAAQLSARHGCHMPLAPNSAGAPPAAAQDATPAFDLCMLIEHYDAGLDIGDTLFGAASRALGTRRLIELLLTIGFFGLVARCCIALNVDSACRLPADAIPQPTATTRGG